MYYSCAGSRSRGVKIRASSLRSNTYFSPGSIFNSSMSSGVKTIHPAFVTSTIRIPQYIKKTGKLYSSWVAGITKGFFTSLSSFEAISLPGLVALIHLVQVAGLLQKMLVEPHAITLPLLGQQPMTLNRVQPNLSHPNNACEQAAW